MFLYKVPWLNHGQAHGSTINSICIDVDGKRIATSGNDCKIRIWNAAAVLNESREKDQATEKLLAVLTDHNSAANVVRWRKDGRLLASGAADGAVCLHHLREGQAPAGFGNAKPNVENWGLSQQALRVHTLDVNDIAWDTEGIRLATASIDNSVIIWKLTEGGMILLKKLDGHTGGVKGVSWDPVGRYLASQGDDKRLIIWNTEDWTQCACVSDAFKCGTESTFFRRLTWTPDGDHLLLPHGRKEYTGKHFAVVISRQGFQVMNELVGHRHAVNVISFSPRIYEPLESGEGGRDKKNHQIFAMGSHDSMVTLWKVGHSRPFAIFSDLFGKTVSDICWHPNGMAMFCTSIDGTIAVMKFKEEDLGGKCLPTADLDDIKRAMYGESRSIQASILVNKSRLQQLAQSKQADGNQPDDVNGRPLANKKPVEKNNLGGTSSGGVGVGPEPMASPPEGLRENKRVKMDTEDKPESGNGISQGERPEVVALKKSIPSNGQMQQQAPVKAVKVMQREEIRKDGRRRIIPQPIGQTAAKLLVNTPVLGGPRTQEAPNPFANNQFARKPEAQHVAHRQAFSQAAPSKGLSAMSTDFPEDQNIMDCAGPPENETPTNDKKALAINFSGPAGKPIEVEIRSVVSKSTSSCKVKATEEGDVIWEDELPCDAVGICGNASRIVIALRDGCLMVYSGYGGRRVMCPFCLGSAAVFLSYSDMTKRSKADSSSGNNSLKPEWLLLAVTRAGKLYVWNLEAKELKYSADMKPLVANCASYSKLGTKTYISNVKLNGVGDPVAVLSNFYSYVYLPKMQVWQRIVDDHITRSRYSSLLNPQNADISEDEELEYLVRSLSGTKEPSIEIRTMLEASKFEEDSATRRHLECLINASVSMSSSSGIKKWIVTYIRQLIHQGTKPAIHALRDLLKQLLDEDSIQPARNRANRSGVSEQNDSASIEWHNILDKEIIPMMNDSIDPGIVRIQTELGEDLQLIKRITS